MSGRRLMKAGGAILATLVASVLYVTPANAVSCTYSACNGKDPSAAGCSAGSATTKEWTSDEKWGKVRIELRHSSSCHTYWVRTTSVWCDNGPYHYHEPRTMGGPILESWYIDYYGKRVRTAYYQGPKSSVNCGKSEVDWTPMTTDRRERVRFTFFYYPGKSEAGNTVRPGCEDC